MHLLQATASSLQHCSARLLRLERRDVWPTVGESSEASARHSILVLPSTCLHACTTRTERGRGEGRSTPSLCSCSYVQTSFMQPRQTPQMRPTDSEPRGACSLSHVSIHLVAAATARCHRVMVTVSKRAKNSANHSSTRVSRKRKYSSALPANPSKPRRRRVQIAASSVGMTRSSAASARTSQITA